MTRSCRSICAGQGISNPPRTTMSSCGCRAAGRTLTTRVSGATTAFPIGSAAGPRSHHSVLLDRAVQNPVRFVAERQQRNVVALALEHDLVRAREAVNALLGKPGAQFAHALGRTEELRCLQTTGRVGIRENHRLFVSSGSVTAWRHSRQTWDLPKRAAAGGVRSDQPGYAAILP